MSTTFTVDFFCSLDGYGMANGWPGYWGKEGPELVEDRVRTFAQDQVLVFGATTIRQFFSSTLEEPLGSERVILAPPVPATELLINNVR